MAKPNFKPSNPLKPIRFQYYERYLPTAFDNTLTILEKLNKIIYQLNEMGVITNEVVQQWNMLIEWLDSEGIQEMVENEINKLIAEGKFDELFNSVIGNLNDLETVNKDNVVNAINETFELTENVKKDVGDINELITDNKTNLVSAINELKNRANLDQQTTLTIGESTGSGIISGLRVHQQNILSMAVDIGDLNIPNIVHLKDGRRYVLNNISLPVEESNPIYNRFDIFYINGNGEISYLMGDATANPEPPKLQEIDVPLALISVQATDTTINSNDIKDLRNHKSLTKLLTNNKSNFVMAINEIIVTMDDVINQAIGDVANLPTNDKSNIVNSIIEIFAVVTDNSNKIQINVQDIQNLKDTKAEKLDVGNKNDLISQDKENLVSAINETIIGLNKVILDVGNKSELTTTDKTNIVNAINELVLNIGNKSNLNTITKVNLVSAINEVLSNLGDIVQLNTTVKSDVVSAINEIVDKLNNEIGDVSSIIGDLNNLETDNKTSVVKAINEIIETNNNEHQEMVNNINQLNDKLKSTTKHTVEILNVKDLPSPLISAKGDGATDDTSALMAVRTYIANLGRQVKLVFPTGIYVYSESPNWAIQNAQIIADGEVRLRYTGDQTAVIIDGSSNVTPVQGNVFNTQFRGFIIEAESKSKDAIYVHAMHHGYVEARVMGCGSAGLRVHHSVCTEFKVAVSGNEEGWYKNARPFWGYYLEQKSSGLIPAYSIFYNTLIEATTIGCIVHASLGNLFLGGTMEGCLDSGIVLNNMASLNKFYGLDYEENGGDDIVIGGFENSFMDCDTTKSVIFTETSKHNTLRGGSHTNIVLLANSERNLVDGIKYNRELHDGKTGIINDLGNGNRLSNNTNVKLNRIENRPPSRKVIPVNTSPFNYTNNSGNSINILISGEITSLTYEHGGIGDLINSVEFMTLFPEDKISVTFTVAPTIIVYEG